MASTRNKNYSGNYCLEQKQFANSAQYTLYPNSQYGAAFDTMMPGNGVNPGQIPWNQLSNNAVQIESFLFGINATNLVNPAPHHITPELIHHGTVNFFEKSKIVQVPQPLVIEKKQRPFPCPN
jgi:hypothetical protein